MPIPEKLSQYALMIEHELDANLQGMTHEPPVLSSAMAYSVCGGGKRVRGALVLGACEAVGGTCEDALPAACAVEMVHAFSLIHDDLPCMDDSDLRRGKPSCHKTFGEAVALLAGDALLTQGIHVLACSHCPAERSLAAVRILLDALGPSGMIGGQVLDMEAEGGKLGLDGLCLVHRRKTGALITACARIGALMGGGSPVEEDALAHYATSFGLAFQIVDDLLDLTGTREHLGKEPGMDLRNEKSTFPGIMGIERAWAFARDEIDKARASLMLFEEKGAFLADLSVYVLERDR